MRINKTGMIVADVITQIIIATTTDSKLFPQNRVDASMERVV
ncbi:hypothetical protein [Risungbinella massiliensis]|nr:hypothetical protein [Risungbinella massiliensis]